MPDHWLSVCHDGTNTYAFYPPVLEDDKLRGASLPSRAMIYTGSWWLLHYILNERMQIYPAWISLTASGPIPSGPTNRGES
ncbi:hypothetical protein [Limisphaera sp. VF-2]|uniref:hypothetical protein n=1 Tax=Limisphaera sp. VF-2 TaxID=3400418 RepID=UPI003C1EA9C4